MFFFVGYENFDNDATTVLAISDYWRNRGLASVIPVEEHHAGVYMAQGRLQRRAAPSLLGCGTAGR